MSGFSAKWNLARAKRKLKRWVKECDKSMMKDLELYCGPAARAMIKCTPPSNAKKGSPAKALKALKERIHEDFFGENPVENYELGWYYDRGQLRVYPLEHGLGWISPFIITGDFFNPGNNAGRYRVQFFAHDLKYWMDEVGQYRVAYSDGVYRLRWHGVRHVVLRDAAEEEVRRRQHLVGKLMNGWKPLADKAGVKMPAAARKGGKGTAVVKPNQQHKAVVEATNMGHYPNLQKIVNGQIKGIVKKNRKLAQKRVKEMGKKLSK